MVRGVSARETGSHNEQNEHKGHKGTKHKGEETEETEEKKNGARIGGALRGSGQRTIDVSG